jgi:hypothetical protein
VITSADDDDDDEREWRMGGAHVFVCECLFESFVGHESHARLDRISNDKGSTASVHPAYAVQAQRLADYREWRLALGVMVALDAHPLVALAKRRKGRGKHTFPPNCERVLTNSIG